MLYLLVVVGSLIFCLGRDLHMWGFRSWAVHAAMPSNLICFARPKERLHGCLGQLVPIWYRSNWRSEVMIHDDQCTTRSLTRKSLAGLARLRIEATEMTVLTLFLGIQYRCIRKAYRRSFQ